MLLEDIPTYRQSTSQIISLVSSFIRILNITALTNKLTYRFATVEDYSSMIVLYSSVYGSGRTVDDLVWMLDRNPAGKGITAIALDGEAVVGMRSLIPYIFHRGSDTVLSYKTEDSLVALGYRKRGIFRQINEILYAHERAALKWGLSNQIEVLRRLGLSGVHQLTSAVYIAGSLSGWRAAKVPFFSMKGLYLVGLMMSGLIRGKARAITDSFLVDSADVEAFMEELALQNAEMLIPDMSVEYLRWRLIDNPHVDNSYVFSAVVDGQTVGISIISVYAGVGRWLSSYFLSTASPEVRQRHIEQGISYLNAQGIGYIESWLFDHNAAVSDMATSMKRAGFSAMKKGLYIHQNEHDIDTENIYFSAQLGIR